MKKKNLFIVLGAVVAVLVLGGLSSMFVNWPVDITNASGDIAKSSRFSRKQAALESNMEELLKSDPEFKNGMVAAYMVMQTRASQFGTLVEMSNEVAGEIPAFADVLKDMAEARTMVNNVCLSLMDAGNDLNAALNGEGRPELAQNTINASLAYTTLQKQNDLANRFIDTTDKYLESNEGSDRLKFVRDQWLDYQQMTAALEGDKASAAALAKKGNLLSAEKTLASIGGFKMSEQVGVLKSANLARELNVPTTIGNAIPQISNVIEVYNSVVVPTVSNTPDLQSTGKVFETIGQNFITQMELIPGWEPLSNSLREGYKLEFNGEVPQLSNGADIPQLSNGAEIPQLSNEIIAGLQQNLVSQFNLAGGPETFVMNDIISVASNPAIQTSFNEVMKVSSTGGLKAVDVPALGVAIQTASIGSTPSLGNVFQQQ
ncbi:MAG: hypothetical protein K6F78_01950 [Bacteroidaceae bacterium]|nr:hypothetical protein [Bacteroidaceae bacterium]